MCVCGPGLSRSVTNHGREGTRAKMEGAVLGSQRDKWELDEGHFYFDGAGKAMLPRASVDAGVSLVQALSKPWTIPGQQDEAKWHSQLLP